MNAESKQVEEPMSKIKLILVYAPYVNPDDYDDCRDIKRHIVIKESKFEEIRNSKLSYLLRFVERFNANEAARKTGNYYMIVYDTEIVMEQCITEQVEFEEKERKIRDEQEAARKKLAEEKETERLKKLAETKEQRLKRKIEKAQAELKNLNK